MDSSKTSSASGANCCRLAITESYGVARSSLGMPSCAPRDSNGNVTPTAPACSRNVNLTAPCMARLSGDVRAFPGRSGAKVSGNFTLSTGLGYFT